MSAFQTGWRSKRMQREYPLSALAHLLYCERRVVLVHRDKAWAESIATVDGRHLHQTADNVFACESRGDIRIARALPLRSKALGLYGVADVVEFHRATSEDSGAVTVPGLKGLWRPFPVEYKNGRLRREQGYIAQLCAQALCLEEMLGCSIPEGALFFGKTRRRLSINFDATLREKTYKNAVQLHELLAMEDLPKPVLSKKCTACSLEHICMPRIGKANAIRYCNDIMDDIRKEAPPCDEC